MRHTLRSLAPILALLTLPALADSELPCEYGTYQSDLAPPNDVIYGTAFPVPGETIHVQLHDAAPNRQALLVTGVRTTEVLLAPGVALLVNPDDVVGVVTDAQGFASLPMTIPDTPDVVGATVYFQWIVMDERAAEYESSTRGLSATVVGAVAPLHEDRAFAGDFQINLSDGRELTASLDVHCAAALARDSDGETDFSLAGLQGGTGPALDRGEELPPFRLQLETPLHFFDQPDAEAGFAADVTLAVSWDLPDQSNEREPEIDEPRWVDFEGTLAWDRLADTPRFTFTGQSLAPGDAGELSGATVTFDVTSEQLEDFSNKVAKKTLCVYVFITRNSAGKKDSTTMAAATAAIEKASEEWCKQCCIQIVIENPDTDGDKKPDPCFLDDDDWQTPNRETMPITYALMVLEAKKKLKAQKSDCVALIFVSDVGGPNTLGEASNGGTFGVIENITPPGKFGHVVAHELGHILGNSHPEEDPKENKKRSPKNLMRDGAPVGSDEIHPEQCAKARARTDLKCPKKKDCVMDPQDSTPVK